MIHITFMLGEKKKIKKITTPAYCSRVGGSEWRFRRGARTQKGKVRKTEKKKMGTIIHPSPYKTLEDTEAGKRAGGGCRRAKSKTLKAYTNQQTSTSTARSISISGLLHCPLWGFSPYTVVPEPPPPPPSPPAASTSSLGWKSMLCTGQGTAGKPCMGLPPLTSHSCPLAHAGGGGDAVKIAHHSLFALSTHFMRCERGQRILSFLEPSEHTHMHMR